MPWSNEAIKKDSEVISETFEEKMFFKNTF